MILHTALRAKNKVDGAREREKWKRRGNFAFLIYHNEANLILEKGTLSSLPPSLWCAEKL
jgi:hypothetical protein